MESLHIPDIPLHFEDILEVSVPLQLQLKDYPEPDPIPEPKKYNSRPIGGPVILEDKNRKDWFMNGARGFITRDHGDHAYTVKFYEPVDDSLIDEYVVHTTQIKADRNATDEDFEYIKGYMRWWYRKELLEQGTR